MNTVKIGNRTLTKEEAENIYYSICVRLGFIETGTNSRAKDLQKRDKNFRPKILSREQMKLILLLEDLKDEFFNTI